jgi:single-strand DNA-binding protein
MAGINKALVLGHIGNDVRLSKTSSGKFIVNLSIITSETWTDKNGQRQEKPQWHKVTIIGKKAQFVSNNCHKGDKVYIEGKFHTTSFQKGGINLETTEILVDNKGEVQFG